MNAPVLRAAALSFALLWGPTPPAGAEEIDALTSPGGIPFLHAPVAESDRVSIQVAWPSDWAYTETDVGAPYVGADLMVAGGAGERDAAAVQQAFEDLQAEVEVRVTADVVTGSLDAGASDLDEAVAIAADALARPVLDERWFERIRDGFASNISQSNASPDALVGQAIRRLIHGDSGLSRFLSTADPDVAAEATLENVRRWHERTFVRSGMLVSVAGGIGAEAAGAAVDALLGGLPPGDEAPEVPGSATDFSPREVLLHVPDAEQGIAALVGPLPPTSEAGELDDIIAALVLGGGESSRLFESVRTRLRAGYAPAAIIDPQTRRARTLVLYAGVDAGKVADARAAMLDAYAALRADGPTDEEVERAVARLREGFERTFEDPSAFAQTVLASALDGYAPERVGALLEELDGVTAETVAARLQSAWPAPGALLQVMLSPDPQAVDGACTVESVAAVSSCGS